MAATTGAIHLWVPFKELHQVITSAIQKKQPDAIQDLESLLRKHKRDFISLLKNPVRNAAHRQAVTKASTEGLSVQGQNTPQLLSADFIREALIISDLFDLNEYAAVELLLAGENQLAYFPGMTRGVVAVILYYDGQVSLVNSLRTLIQAHDGRTWTLGLGAELSMTVNKYTDQLMNEGMVLRILDLIKTIDTTKEMEKLQHEKALGPPRYRKQVHSLIEEIQLSLAECIFCLACQSGLSKENTVQLIAHLQQVDNLGSSDATLTHVNLTLTMALLYSFDVRLLEHEDSQDVFEKLPLINDPSYIPDIHDHLISDREWKLPALKALIQFVWSVTLRALSQYPDIQGINEYCESDEHLAQIAINNGVFHFITHSILACENFYKEEFYLREMHNIIADFIVLMPLKLKELRNQGDETARMILAHAHEGLEPPSNLPRHFEHLLLLISELYGSDPLELELGLEYWCPVDPAANATQNDYNQTYQYRPPQRQISLHKFVRQAGDLLPPTLYIPYIQMLTGLATGPQCAHHCFTLLKGGQTSTVSWDHFFSSMNQYYTNMRQDQPATSDMAHIYMQYNARNINPQEIEGLMVVLKLVQKVASLDETARLCMYENHQWSPIVVILGLISCSIPPYLKAELFNTVSALVKTPEIATAFWQLLESSQILQTVPCHAHHQGGASGMLVELDEVEASNETFPLTRSFVNLLDILTDVPVPKALGAGHRTPGFEPYLDFLIDSVFLKFNTRAYKNPTEKWQVAACVLRVLHKLLTEHETIADHFVEQFLEMQTGGKVSVNKPPGHTVLTYLYSDSRLLKMLLYIIDEGTRQLDQYRNFDGKTDLEEAALLSLKMISTGFDKQESFMTAIRDSGSSLLVSTLDRLLLAVNPRTAQPDHLVTITKYVVYNNLLSEHTYEAVKVLCWVSQSSYAQPELVGLFTANRADSQELLHGFVECLETEDLEGEQLEEDDMSRSQVRNATRQRIIHLMLYAMEQPAPNLAHFLLGFQLRSPVCKTDLQDPGVMGSSRSCLHSVLSILERGGGSSYGPTCCYETPQLADLCYKLIYTLCANKDTSTPIMRYLRTTQDFLHKHVQHIPFTLPDGGHWPQATDQLLLSQQSWLLKAVATELRLTSVNRQRSHTHRLVQLLLDDNPSSQSKVLQADGVYEPDYTSYDLEFSTFTNTQSYVQQTMLAGGQARRKLLSMLEAIDFKQPTCEIPELSMIEPALVQQLIDMCAQSNVTQSGVYYNIKKLHQLLLSELQHRHGSTVTIQRSAFYQDIESICKSMVERNNMQALIYTKKSVFDSWRQVIEVILNACPEDILSTEQRTSAITEILQDLLKKISDDECAAEMSSPVSGVILTLLSNLRLCFLQKATQTDLPTNLTSSKYLDPNAKPSGMAYASMDTAVNNQPGSSVGLAGFQNNSSISLAGMLPYDQTVASTLNQYSSSLQLVLTGIIEYLMRSSSTMQRVRVNLYGALLYFLQIAQKPKTQQMLDKVSGSSSTGVGVNVLLGTPDIDQLTQANMSLIAGYGENFMDIVCRDACDGHHVCRMLAFSTLDAMLSSDSQQNWLSFMTSKGYIQHFVDSLLVDNEQLNNIIDTAQPQPQTLKTLYIYQSKMSVLMRLAASVSGAHTLLQCSVMGRLAECTMLDMRPDPNSPVNESLGSIGTTMMSTYHDLLFPALRLCLAVLTSTGLENREARNQVLQFVLGHIELFSTVLSDHRGSFSSEVTYLQELAFVTAIVSRTAIDDDTDGYMLIEMAGVELRSHLSHLEQLMLALLPRYSLLDRNTSHIQHPRVPTHTPHAHAPHIPHGQSHSTATQQDTQRTLTLEVLCNVTTFGRAVIASSAKTAALTRILFAPHLGDGLPNEDRAGMLSTRGRPPSLAMLLTLLVQSIKQFNVSLDVHKQHTRKLDSLPSLTSEEIKEICALKDDNVTNQQQQQMVARKIVSQLIIQKSHECAHLTYIIENCLYMLWRHMDYYLVYCVPANQGTSLHKLSMRKQLRKLTDMTGLSSPDSSLLDSSSSNKEPAINSSVTKEQLDQLKKDMALCLGDTLFKRIRDMEQCYGRSRSHYSFVEALMRRIEGLVNLHSTA